MRTNVVSESAILLICFGFVAVASTEVDGQIQLSSRKNECAQAKLASFRTDCAVEGVHLPSSTHDEVPKDLLLSNVSKPCTEHVLHLMNQDINFVQQSLNIASGIENRLRRLKDVWPRTFQDCLSLRSTIPLPSGKNIKIQGQHCLVYFLDPSGPNMNHEHVALLKGKRFNGRYPVALAETGLCLPDSCSSRDVEKIIEFYLGESASKWTIFSTPERCRTDKPLPVSMFTKFVVFGLGILVLLAIVGSLLEVYDGMQKRKRASEDCNENGGQIKYNESIGRSAVKCFSLFSNSWYLFKMDTQLPGSVEAFNGARFLAVLGCQVVHLTILGNNINGWSNIEEAPFIQAISYRGFVHLSVMLQIAVLISGCGIGMSAFHRIYEKDKQFFILSFYLRRIYRLSVPYFIYLALLVGVLPHLASGPRWSDVLNIVEECKGKWWTNVFYVNNYIGSDRMCLFHSWYLSTDIHLLLIAPIIIMAYYRSPRLGIMVTLMCISISVCKLGYHSYYDGLNPTDLNINPSLWKLQDYFTKLYLLPYSRLGCYSLSISTGYFLYTHGKTFTLSPVMQQRLAYFFALIFWSPLLLWYHYDNNRSPTSIEGVLCETFGRITWSMSVAYLTVAMYCNFQDPYTRGFRWLLYRKIFVLTSKLHYSVYLLHVIVIHVYYATRPEAIEYSPSEFVKLMFGLLFVSHLVAIPFTLMAEIPFFRLERLFEDKWNLKKIEKEAEFVSKVK